MNEVELLNSDTYFFALSDFSSREIPNIKKIKLEKHKRL